MFPLIIGQPPFPGHKIDHLARRKALERRQAKTGSRTAVVALPDIEIGKIRPPAAAQAQLEARPIAALKQKDAQAATRGLTGTEKTGCPRAKNNDVKRGAAAVSQRGMRIVNSDRRVYSKVLHRKSVHAGFVAYEVQSCQ